MVSAGSIKRPHFSSTPNGLWLKLWLKQLIMYELIGIPEPEPTLWLPSPANAGYGTTF